jgi:hypothetical protein
MPAMRDSTPVAYPKSPPRDSFQIEKLPKVEVIVLHVPKLHLGTRKFRLPFSQRPSYIWEAMNKVLLLLLLSLFLSGCADYSVGTSVDGVRRPSDLVPQPFPDPPPAAQN